MFSPSTLRRSLTIATCLAIVSCSTTEEEMVSQPVESLYNTAKDKLDSGNYNQAAKAFAEVERQHPYSAWSLKAQLLSAYSYYEAKKYDEAIEGFNVFIQLHPGHENIAYAYYMVGLCYYEQIPSVKRDQEVTFKAKQAFEEVTRRFPTSPYARDAQFKIDLVLDHMAGKEMDVGRYYLARKSYLAAVNRFKNVVEQFQTSTHTPEALHRMIECYLAQGMVEEAQKTAAVLGYNYPGSPWYADAYSLVMAVKPATSLPEKQATTPLTQEKVDPVAIKPPVQ